MVQEDIGVLSTPRYLVGSALAHLGFIVHVWKERRGILVQSHEAAISVPEDLSFAEGNFLASRPLGDLDQDRVSAFSLAFPSIFLHCLMGQSVMEGNINSDGFCRQ